VAPELWECAGPGSAEAVRERWVQKNGAWYKGERLGAFCTHCDGFDDVPDAFVHRPGCPKAPSERGTNHDPERLTWAYYRTVCEAAERFGTRNDPDVVAHLDRLARDIESGRGALADWSGGWSCEMSPGMRNRSYIDEDRERLIDEARD
jgi:hypothetical protein